MYTTKTIEEIVKEAYKYSDYKLCYIDDIPQTFSGYDEVDKEWVDISNFEYEEGKQEYYAYFTPVSLADQWGDDWDDYPYNHNAEPPYDSSYKEKDEHGNWKEYEIIRVPFYVPGSCVYFAKDWGYGNCPFSVKDINAGAVAWLYYTGPEDKSCRGSVVVKAGDNPFEFVEKIEKINEALND